VFISRLRRERKKGKGTAAAKERKYTRSHSHMCRCVVMLGRTNAGKHHRRENRDRNANFDHFSSSVDLFVSRNNRLPIRNQHNISVTHDDA